MKKTFKKAIVSILFCLLLSSPLCSCAKDIASSDTSDKPSVEQQTEHTNSISESIISGSNITNDKYEEQIKHYMELVEKLEAELLALKAEQYINESEYLLQIAVLNQSIKNLEDSISASTESNGNHSNDILSSKSEFQFSVERGTVIITGYVGNSIDVTIPSSINGLPVTKIGESAFQNAHITTITIPSSVKDIGWFAFSGCTELKSISIPSSVTSIGYGAFDGCSSHLEISCDKGSYAEQYADSWALRKIEK